MRISRLALVAALVTPGLPLVAARAEDSVSNAGVTATFEATQARLSNGRVTRTFDRSSFTTLEVSLDGVPLGGISSEFRLGLADMMLAGDIIPVSTTTAEAVDGGVRLTRRGVVPGVVEIERTIEMYGGIAGTRARTTLDLLAPTVVSGYSLDEIAIADAIPTVHALRAGADWRYDAGWNPAGVGDPRKGTWRESITAPRGEDLRASGEWLQLDGPQGPSAALVMERHDYASSQGRYEGGQGQAFVDLTRDIIYTGPIEESAHFENPTTLPVGRARAIVGTLALEPAWLALGADADEVAASMQALLAQRSGDLQRRVVFNTNNVDSNRISTGAKDDVDFETFKQLARAAREAGIDTFVLDDGWQAASGDWCPDSPACPEPRRDRDPVKFAPRFPDENFDAVRAFLADDPDTPEDDADLDLGLWMTPMEFHPASSAYRTNPQWACAPVGAATPLLSVAQPDSGSNEAGLGVWNPLAWGVNPENTTEPMRAIDWIESRIDRAITRYGAVYFKFDFLVWLDCAGAQPVDQYQYREAFLSMLDRLRAAHPQVLFSIDETNDYRMFPYESVSRGATWFQNGSPTMRQALHNIWNLSPFVPGYALGQGIASRGDEVGTLGLDTLMSGGVTSHLTIWRDLRAFSPSQRATLKRWNDWYRANADSVATMTYPLLSDPLEAGWTALQPWDQASRSGWILAYRQRDPAADTRVPLAALGQVPGSDLFALTAVDPGTGSSVSLGTMSAEDLRTVGAPVAAARDGYAFIRVVPA